LATASLDPVASAVVYELGLTGMVCSWLSYDSRDRCQGRLRSDALGRKWQLLSRAVGPQYLVPMEVYTDNIEDVDLILHAERVFFLGSKGKLRYVPELDANRIVIVDGP